MVPCETILFMSVGHQKAKAGMEASRAIAKGAIKTEGDMI